jgi:hypothetical protein
MFVTIMANTAFLLPEDQSEDQIKLQERTFTPPIESPSLKADLPETPTRLDERMQRALEVITRMEGEEPHAQFDPKPVHLDTAGLFWGLAANLIFGIFAFLGTGWAAIFSTLRGPDSGVVVLWSILFTQLVNALCGSVTYRVCYRDTTVGRWDLTNHARYNAKILMGILTGVQFLFTCFNPSYAQFLGVLLTPIATWLGAMRAERRYKSGLIR